MRRSFIAAGEIPGLLQGALRGDPVSLRRLLGARRGGRWGLLMLAVGLLLALPTPGSIFPLLALHLALALYVVIPRIDLAKLELRQELVLSLWTVAPLLVVLAPLHWIWPLGAWPAATAVLLGHLLVWRGAQRIEASA